MPRITGDSKLVQQKISNLYAHPSCGLCCACGVHIDALQMPKITVDSRFSAAKVFQTYTVPSKRNRKLGPLQLQNVADFVTQLKLPHTFAQCHMSIATKTFSKKLHLMPRAELLHQIHQDLPQHSALHPPCNDVSQPGAPRTA